MLLDILKIGGGVIGGALLTIGSKVAYDKIKKTDEVEIKLSAEDVGEELSGVYVVKKSDIEKAGKGVCKKDLIKKVKERNESVERRGD